MVPIARCSARANTEPKSGLRMIPTVSTSQYDRCSGSTSLSTAATPVQSMNRIVYSHAIRPP